jgi:FAD/FMN-containing dehydrogenase
MSRVTQPSARGGDDVGIVGELRAALTGRVVAPGDDGWEPARQAWNLHVPQRPAVVVEAAGVADVAAAVRVAARRGLAVAAQPRGHGATAALDGTILLRPTGLCELCVDVDARTARIGAGIRWQEFNDALSGTGLSSLPGSSSDPSVVGYTIGGGLSWFGRRFGLAAHQIRAIELVDPDGRQMRVTVDSDPDLFWALRGGGGDFGIVTALEVNLLPVHRIHGGRLLWPIDQATAVAAAFLEVTATAPEELTVWLSLLHLPDLPDVPPPLRGRWVAAVDMTHLGNTTDADDAERALRPLLGQLPPPLAGALGPVALADLGAIAAEPTEPTPLMDAALLLDTHTAPALDALLDAVPPDPLSPLAVVMLRHLGGALARPAEHHGAAGHIPQPFLLVMGGPVPDPLAAPGLAAAIDRVTAAMRPYSSGRLPPNFGTDAASVYPPDVLARLRAIKQQRDPHGVIRSNRPLT